MKDLTIKKKLQLLNKFIKLGYDKTMNSTSNELEDMFVNYLSDFPKDVLLILQSKFTELLKTTQQ